MAKKYKREITCFSFILKTIKKKKKNQEKSLGAAHLCYMHMPEGGGAAGHS
jgi:hypothetical protein